MLISRPLEEVGVSKCFTARDVSVVSRGDAPNDRFDLANRSDTPAEFYHGKYKERRVIVFEYSAFGIAQTVRGEKRRGVKQPT